MRLIDADALLKHSTKVVEYDETGFSMEYNAISTEEIKRQPTAYDVEVVVAELEEFFSLEYACEENKYIQDCCGKNDCAQCYKKVIKKIVRKGGVEHEN